MKWFGKIISKLYWKYGKKYDDNNFWSNVIIWYVGETNISGRYLFMEFKEHLELSADAMWDGSTLVWSEEGLYPETEVISDE